MNIAKIIRAYFVFVMCGVAVASLSYNDTVKYYMASVFNFESDSADSTAFSADIESNAETVANSTGIINFVIDNNPNEAFAQPGAKSVPIMHFKMRTFDESVTVKSLKLKLAGVENKLVEKVFLTKGREIIAVGKKKGEYFDFKNIDFHLAKNSSGIINVIVDVSAELTTGNRFRLDIEKPEDIVILAGTDVYSVTGSYPLRGKYLSIAKSRPWNFKKKK